MNQYADTSFLVSLYVTDVHSLTADQWRIAHPDPLPFTRFHRVEFRNALSLAIYRKRLGQEQADAVWNDLESDMQNGLLVDPPVDWSAVLTQADDLATRLTPSTGSRTLDIMHVSAAVVLGIRSLVSFDNRQNKLAQLAGLTILTEAGA